MLCLYYQQAAFFMHDHSLTQPDSSATPIRFYGTASEYFGIWITNLLLTIVTFGIYSAWAKVRTQRYFYGNTEIDGHSFQYHANPVSILFGRLFVIAAILFIDGSHFVSPTLYFILAAALFFALPALINGSLRFNARMTTYRNVQFDFQSTYWKAFWACLIAPIIGVLTFFIFMPAASKILHEYLADGFSYGGAKFELQNRLRPYIEAYLVAVSLLLLLISATFFLYVSGFIGTGLPQQGQTVPPGQLTYFLLVTFLAIAAFSTFPTRSK